MAISKPQVILVTGATSGIGLETIYQLSLKPSRHLLLGARSIPKAEQLLNQLQSRTPPPASPITPIQVDLTSDQSISSAHDTIKQSHGYLNILINNAAIAAPYEITGDKITREEIRKVFETNVFGTMLLSNALLPLLKESSNPLILNISSVMGSITLKSDPDCAFADVPVEIYRMSKSALNMLTACQNVAFRQENEGKEGKGRGRAVSYCPGRVATNLDGGVDMSEEEQKANGMMSSEEAARGVVEVVDGGRDGEIGDGGVFIAQGGVVHPW